MIAELGMRVKVTGTKDEGIIIAIEGVRSPALLNTYSRVTIVTVKLDSGVEMDYEINELRKKE